MVKPYFLTVVPKQISSHSHIKKHLLSTLNGTNRSTIGLSQYRVTSHSYIIIKYTSFVRNNKLSYPSPYSVIRFKNVL